MKEETGSDADAHQVETLAWASDRGIAARGNIGDPIHPMLAIEDQVRDYSADEILVATHPSGKANWFEPEMVGQMRTQLKLPITQVEVDRETGRATVIP